MFFFFFWIWVFIRIALEGFNFVSNNFIAMSFVGILLLFLSVVVLVNILFISFYVVVAVTPNGVTCCGEAEDAMCTSPKNILFHVVLDFALLTV